MPRNCCQPSRPSTQEAKTEAQEEEPTKAQDEAEKELPANSKKLEDKAERQEGSTDQAKEKSNKEKDVKPNVPMAVCDLVTHATLSDLPQQPLPLEGVNNQEDVEDGKKQGNVQANDADEEEDEAEERAADWKKDMAAERNSSAAHLAKELEAGAAADQAAWEEAQRQAVHAIRNRQGYSGPYLECLN